MMNIADLVLGLTGKLITSLLSWPFLLFVFLVWLANRYRDQIGSMLERRGTIKRTDFSSAVRNELESVNKEIGDLKLVSNELRSQVSRIESTRSGHSVTSALEPIDGRIKALETGIEKVRSEMEHLLGTALPGALGQKIQPLNEEIGGLRANVERLEGRLAELDAKDPTDLLKSAIDRVQGDVEALRSDVAGLSSQIENLAPRAMTDALELGMEETTKDLLELRETVGGLRIPLERLSSQVVNLGSETGELPADSMGNRALPLEIMKQEMRSSRWEWRRVRRLAKSVGMTEEAAEAILESDPEVTVSKDDWGRKIAKLADR